jgi:hypothetical protein
MSEVEALRLELVRRGLLDADVPAFEPAAGRRPWYLTLLLGCAGWLAGIFGLVCFGLTFTPKGVLEFTLVGVFGLGVAYAFYGIARGSVFFDQLALALSIAGQLAIAFAAAEATDFGTATAALVAVLEIVLVVVMPNRFAKLLSTIFAAIAWALALWLHWKLYRIEPQSASFWRVLVVWLVVWLPLAACLQWLIARESLWIARGWQHLARPVLNGLIVSLAFGTLISAPLATFGLGSAKPGLSWLVLWPLLGTSAALFAVFAAFRVRRRALAGAAIVAALLHVSQTYFLVSTTLLVKAAVMLAVGVALLLGAMLLDRRMQVA